MDYLTAIDRLDELENKVAAHQMGIFPLTEAELFEIKKERIVCKCVLSEHHDG